MSEKVIEFIFFYIQAAYVEFEVAFRCMNKLFACHLLTFQNVKTISVYKYVEYSVNL